MSAEEDRLLVKVSVKDAKLSVRRFAVHEALSSPFTIAVWAGSKQHDIDLEEVVGQPAHFHTKNGNEIRRWDGIVSHAEQLQRETTGLSTYFLRIVPQLWMLTQKREHRLFQHRSITDIVKEILAEWHVEASWKIGDKNDAGEPLYPKLELRTQYGESDFAFVSRLLEEAGISYAFVRGALTFLDEPHAAAARTGQLPIVDSPNEAPDTDYLTNVRLSHEVRPGKYTVRDYDFRRPNHPPPTAAQTATHPRETKYEQYEFAPGSFLALADKAADKKNSADKPAAYRHLVPAGDERARRALGSARTHKRNVSFRTNLIDLAPGVVMEVRDDKARTQLDKKRLLVTELSLEGEVFDEWTIVGTAAFADDGLRPARVTPKPRIDGVQSARVVGSADEKDIHTDEYGRVRVQFHWDRDGKLADAIWMRVSQGWAGTGFGLVTLPRVGQEVLVAFLDGDPDQPVVVGRLYNEINRLPYDLPDNKTISAFRSQTPDTGDHNELAFEDRKGQQLFYVRAQRNLSQHVLADDVERVDKSLLLTVGESRDLVVHKVSKELVGGNDHRRVGGERMEKVDGSAFLTVGRSHHVKIGDSYALEADKTILIKAGTTVVVEAPTVALKGDGGFVVCDKSGVTIVGKLVRINSGGSAPKSPKCDPVLPEDATEVTHGDDGERARHLERPAEKK